MEHLKHQYEDEIEVLKQTQQYQLSEIDRKNKKLEKIQEDINELRYLMIHQTLNLLLI